MAAMHGIEERTSNATLPPVPMRQAKEQAQTAGRQYQESNIIYGTDKCFAYVKTNLLAI